MKMTSFTGMTGRKTIFSTRSLWFSGQREAQTLSNSLSKLKVKWWVVLTACIQEKYKEGNIAKKAKQLKNLNIYTMCIIALQF